MLARRDALILGAASFIRCAPSRADQPNANRQGPFGLPWGASVADVKSLGVNLAADGGKSDFGAGFEATSLPKVLSDVEIVKLYFGFRDRLWRVVAIGPSEGPDPFGNRVISRYSELSESLSRKYGRGAETDDRDTEVWKNSNEYIASIKQGRASRYTNFSGPEATVQLSIRALDSNTAYYLIIFEWRTGELEFDADKKAREKDAL